MLALRGQQWDITSTDVIFSFQIILEIIFVRSGCKVLFFSRYDKHFILLVS